jgi:hypothetical protein
LRTHPGIFHAPRLPELGPLIGQFGNDTALLNMRAASQERAAKAALDAGEVRLNART